MFDDSPKVINPITPIPIASVDQQILRDIRKAVSDGDEEFDPVEESATSNEMAAMPKRTSSSMRLPPHTQYIIRSGDFDIFAEVQGAVCKHLRLGYFPGPIILPRSPYERLAWDKLTAKPFNGIYQFMIDRMTLPLLLPVYQDNHYGLILPHDVILCIIP